MRRRKRSAQRLRREQISIKGEVDYITRRAGDRDARVVTLGALVFFSTETGDAWMLDPQDGLALCLARDGAPQPIRITETEASFAIEWNSEYQIKGDLFIVTDKLGRTWTVIGYPTQEILKATRSSRD